MRLRRWVIAVVALLLIAGAIGWRWKHPRQNWRCIDHSRVGQLDLFHRARYTQEDLISIRVHWDETGGGAEFLGTQAPRKKRLTPDEAKATAKKIVAALYEPYDPATVRRGQTDVVVGLSCGDGEGGVVAMNAPLNDARFSISECRPGSETAYARGGFFECLRAWERLEYEIPVDPRADFVAEVIRQQLEVLKNAPNATP